MNSNSSDGIAPCSIRQYEVQFIDKIAGRDTAPPGFLNNTKQFLRPNVTLLKEFSDYSDSSCALARTNGSNSFVLDLFVSFSIKGKRKEIRMQRQLI